MGANRNWRGMIRTLDPNIVELYGQFTGAGAAPITSVRCLGFTIARTGVGLFTITLDDQYVTSEDGTPPLYAIQASIKAAAAVATGTMQVIVDNSAAAAKTITTRWAVGGVAADVAAADVVMLALVLRNSGAPRKGA